MTRADWLLLLILCFTIGALLRWTWVPQTQAQWASIHGEGFAQRLNLDEDHRLEVAGPLGTSVIEIRDGRVHFASSPCRHQICVRSGWHERSGSVAACVPNRISFVLGGAPREYDGLSY